MMTPAAIARLYPATTHWICSALADRSRCVFGMATLTMKKSNVIMKVPARTISRVAHSGTERGGLSCAA